MTKTHYIKVTLSDRRTTQLIHLPAYKRVQLRLLVASTVKAFLAAAYPPTPRKVRTNDYKVVFFIRSVLPCTTTDLMRAARKRMIPMRTVRRVAAGIGVQHSQSMWTLPSRE